MSEELKQKDIKLTGKQKLFADYYGGEANLNATTATKSITRINSGQWLCDWRRRAVNGLRKP
jgi:hypothetical protein